MATVRRVRPGDLLKLNLCNLDALTENYDLNFYLTYLMKWPSLFQCIEEHGQIVGYSTASPQYSPVPQSTTLLPIVAAPLTPPSLFL